MNNLADHIRNAYPDKKQKDLIPILQDIQEQYGYISENHIQLASEMLNVSGSKIYGIASFYDQFKFTPKAKIEVKICTCPACHIMGSHKLMAFLKLKLNIQDNLHSKDNTFSIEEAPCLGACDKAPVIQINNTYFYQVDKNKTEQIINAVTNN